MNLAHVFTYRLPLLYMLNTTNHLHSFMVRCSFMFLLCTHYALFLVYVFTVCLETSLVDLEDNTWLDSPLELSQGKNTVCN